MCTNGLSPGLHKGCLCCFECEQLVTGLKNQKINPTLNSSWSSQAETQIALCSLSFFHGWSVKVHQFSAFSFFNNQSYHLKINWWDKTITLPWVSGVPSTLARLIWNKASAKWEAPQLYTGKRERQSFKWGFLSTSCLFSLPSAHWDPNNSTLVEKMLFTGPYGEHAPQDYLIGWQGYNAVIAITKKLLTLPMLTELPLREMETWNKLV